MGRLLVVAVWLVACAGRAAAGNTVADIADVPGSGWTRLWRDEFRPRRGGLSKWDMEVGTGCQYYSNPVDKYPLCGWGEADAAGTALPPPLSPLLLRSSFADSALGSTPSKIHLVIAPSLCHAQATMSWSTTPHRMRRSRMGSW